MDSRPIVAPLPHRTRKRVFFTLFAIFVITLPFLLLYAKGYHFDILKPTNIYGTGGLYIAVERTGAEIYIDGELVRETRAFRKAFYAQNIEPGTHRVHVQKEGYHTWVKELPVTAHLVTEAESFTLPIVPTVRVIAPWQTATGTMVVRTELLATTTSNPTMATTSRATSTLLQNTEYLNLIEYFATSAPTSSPVSTTVRDRVTEILTSESTTATDTAPTTTVETTGVRLYESDGEVYARWIGPFEQMPYYYCAEDFPRYSTTTDDEAAIKPEVSQLALAQSKSIEQSEVDDGVALIHPVQSVPKDTTCDPVIKMDRRWQTVTSFEFFPGSSDLVLMTLEDGVYVVEIDDRAWQNMQPLLLGSNLRTHVENGGIYVYDGTLIYQVILSP